MLKDDNFATWHGMFWSTSNCWPREFLPRRVYIFFCFVQAYCFSMPPILQRYYRHGIFYCSKQPVSILSLSLSLVHRSCDQSKPSAVWHFIVALELIKPYCIKYSYLFISKE